MRIRLRREFLSPRHSIAKCEFRNVKWFEDGVNGRRSRLGEKFCGGILVPPTNLPSKVDRGGKFGRYGGGNSCRPGIPLKNVRRTPSGMIAPARPFRSGRAGKEECGWRRSSIALLHHSSSPLSALFSSGEVNTHRFATRCISPYPAVLSIRQSFLNRRTNGSPSRSHSHRAHSF